jgi:hypothetical protein
MYDYATHLVVMIVRCIQDHNVAMVQSLASVFEAVVYLVSYGEPART